MDFERECQQLFDHYLSSYRAGDAVGCASVFSADAELYSPYGPTAIGCDAIASVHREWLEEGGEDKQLEVKSAGANGTLGWCVVRFSEGTTGDGYSVNVLAREPSGRWLITHCSLNEAQEAQAP
ncbi:MAG: nuclear transport factor 2 family protein [Pseudomonadota bacterium]